MMGLLPLVGANDECVIDAVLAPITTTIGSKTHLTAFLDLPMEASDPSPLARNCV